MLENQSAQLSGSLWPDSCDRIPVVSDPCGRIPLAGTLGRIPVAGYEWVGNSRIRSDHWFVLEIITKELKDNHKTKPREDFLVYSFLS